MFNTCPRPLRAAILSGDVIWSQSACSSEVGGALSSRPSPVAAYHDGSAPLFSLINTLKPNR